MRTAISIYRNKKNENKYIEVHSDGYGHNSVIQYMYWQITPINSVKVKNGDGCLHRWRKQNLADLLEDYVLV